MSTLSQEARTHQCESHSLAELSSNVLKSTASGWLHGWPGGGIPSAVPPACWDFSELAFLSHVLGMVQRSHQLIVPRSPVNPLGGSYSATNPFHWNITLAISASLLVRGKDKHFPIHIHIHLYFCQEIFINEVLNFKAWGGEEFTFLSFFLQSTALKTENKWSYFYDMVVLISAKFQCDLIQGEACIRLWAFFGVKWPLCLHKSMLERQGTFFSLCSRSLEIVKIIKTFTVLSPWRLSHEKFMPNKSS